MAAGEGGDEEVLVEPPDEASAPEEGNAVVNALASIANVFLDKIGVTTNDAPTPPATVKTIPALAEQKVQGYKGGVPFELTVVNVYGKWVEKNTAYDFLLMRDAAKADGIDISINVGFRTYAVQEVLRRERVNPDGTLTALGQKYGVAAKPGFSNHQQGIALDLLVDMTIADRRAGRFSAKFLWLQENAGRFGFDNTEVPSEPWHWRHQPTTIVGPRKEDKDYLLSLVDTAATAAAASQKALKSQGQQLMDRAAHAVSSAQARSAAMMKTGRGELYANTGAFSVFRAAAIQAIAALYGKSAAEMPQAPPNITKEASKAVSFDFNTGTWGDGRSN